LYRSAVDAVDELTIKVPGPFAGIDDLGLTAQYPRQDPYSAPRDIPLVIEGPPAPMGVLTQHLRLLREAGRDQAHAWSDPIMLSDEVVLMAFRDRGLEGATFADGARASLGYVLNLARPVVFPFLRDCARVARLRLADQIEITVMAPSRVAEFRLAPEEIVQPNGETLLWSL
jgi:hypothetical protein